jgi:hypothetical protein
MNEFTSILAEIMPALIFCGGLLWNFSKSITKIEAKLQALEHQLDDCKKGIEGNRQGRLEIFGVINGTLKPKDNQLSERLAKVEVRVIAPSEVYTRLAKIEAEIEKK